MQSSEWLQLNLVEETAAGARAAEAGDFLVLQRELVVVSDLLACADLALRVDDDLLRALHLNHLRDAVGLKAENRK